MTPSEWLAAVSASAAVVAVGVAVWSLRTARQALAASLSQEARHESPIEVYLADSHILRLRSERRRLHIFQLVITNRSDLANSIRTLTLGLQYVRQGNPMPLVSIPHTAHPPRGEHKTFEVLTVPFPLPPRGVVAGAAVFDVSDDVLSGADVESYRISVSDALERVTHLETIVVQERVDDEILETRGDSASE